MYLLNEVFPPGKPAPSLVTVFLGANDATRAEYGCRQHVPLAEYVANLRLIVRHVQALGTPAHPVHIVLIAPPPIDEEARLVFQRIKYPESATGLNERTLQLSGTYARACVDLAAEMGCVAARALGVGPAVSVVRVCACVRAFFVCVWVCGCARVCVQEKHSQLSHDPIGRVGRGVRRGSVPCVVLLVFSTPLPPWAVCRVWTHGAACRRWAPMAPGSAS
jgi:hypothetical protein